MYEQEERYRRARSSHGHPVRVPAKCSNVFVDPSEGLTLCLTKVSIYAGSEYRGRQLTVVKTEVPNPSILDLLSAKKAEGCEDAFNVYVSD